MGTNQYVKPLKAFDPKTDLTINESFKSLVISSNADDLADLETGDFDEGIGGNAGKECCSYKTGGAIGAGILKVTDTPQGTVLIVSNMQGEVYLLQLEQGSLNELDKFRIHGTIESTPSYADGILYITTKEGGIYAVNTGLAADREQSRGGPKAEILWQQKLKKGILTEPVATGKMLVVASLGGLYCFEAYFKDEINKAIGKKLWAKRISGVASSPRIHGGQIFLGSEDRVLYALEYGGRNIGKSWSYKTSGAIRSKPCVSRKKDMVLAPTVDGFVYCVNRTSGKYLWNFVVRAPVVSNIVSAVLGTEEYFFFGADNGIFYCINSFGKRLWEFKTAGKIRSEALISGQYIFFGSEDNNLYALNIRNGNMVFDYSTDGNINSAPVLVDDTVFFGSTDSFVHGVFIK